MFLYMKLKGKCYRTVVRPPLGSVSGSQERRMQVAEMRMLWYTSGGRGLPE